MNRYLKTASLAMALVMALNFCGLLTMNVAAAAESGASLTPIPGKSASRAPVIRELGEYQEYVPAPEGVLPEIDRQQKVSVEEVLAQRKEEQQAQREQAREARQVERDAHSKRMHSMLEQNLFSNLSEFDKEYLSAYGVNLDAMATMESQGKTIAESLIYARVVHFSGLTLSEVESRYPDPDACSDVLASLGRYQSEIVPSAVDTAAKEWAKSKILDGETFDAVVAAYGISEGTGIDKDSLLEPRASRNAWFGKKKAIQVFSDDIEMNADVLSEYAEQNNLDADELQLEMNTHSANSKLIQLTSGTSSSPTFPAVVDDIKSYVQAPFVYNQSGNESISLNSGSLNYQLTDFVLPGKNGLDLDITRTYNSSKANVNDFDSEKITGKGLSYYVITIKTDQYYKGKKYDSWTWVYDKQYGYRATEPDFQALYDNDYENAKSQALYDYPTSYRDQDYRETNKHSYSKGRIEQIYYTTTTRANTHLTSTYGLGYGWSFAFPSIEAVPSTIRKDYISYTDYLHLANGGSYAIEGNSATGSNLKDYNLTDIRIQKQSGTFTPKYGTATPYTYVIYYKDGIRDYLNEGKIVGREDRFGNTIRFNFIANGGAIIVDSVGRTVVLEKSGSTLTWKIPDNSTTVRYTVSGGRLTNSYDQQNRRTQYQYTEQQVTSRNGWLRHDYGANINYVNLAKIIHPTNAQSVFTYTSQKYVTNSTAGIDQHIGYNLMASRKDIPDSAQPSNVINQETFSFSINKDDDKKVYIHTATMNKSDSTVHTYTFNSDSLPTNEQIKHAGAVMSTTSYTYVNKLPTVETNTTYNAARQSISTTHRYAYDTQGNLTSTTDPYNNVTTMTYDTANYSLPTSITYQQNASTTIVESYELRADKKATARRKITENGTLKSLTEFEYDSNNNISKEKRYYGNLDSPGDNYHATEFFYAQPGAGLPAGFTGAFLTQMKVSGVKDADDQPIESPYGDGVVQESYQYDWFGRLTEVKGPADVDDVTTYTYDKLGRVLTETHGNGELSVSNQYNDSANTIITTDAQGNKTRLQYTPLGWISGVYDHDNNVQLAAYSYDHRGRVQREYAYGQGGSGTTVVSNSYDRYDRPTQKLYLDDTVQIGKETYAYDDAVQSQYQKVTKTVQGEVGAPNIVSFTYTDKMGRVVKDGYVVDGAEQASTYTYDIQGNVLTYQSAMDAARGITTGRWEYDYAGRAVKETNALEQYTQSSYDELGNLVSFTDIKGDQAETPYSTTYQYDSLGRLLVRNTPFTDAADAVARFHYDAAGRVIRQESSNNAPGAAASFTLLESQYDALGRLTQVQSLADDADTMTTSYTYDANGNRTSATTGGKTTRYEYDRFGNVTKRIDALSQEETYQYNPQGTILSKTDRNGNTTSYTLDALGRTRSETVRTPDSQVIGTLELTYTSTGQKKSAVNDTLSISYQYDEVGRLTSETDSSGASKSYAYNLAGQRTSFTLNKDGVVLTNTYGYDNLNRLTSVSSDGETVAGYTYDLNGNRQTMTGANGVEVEYEYNRANLITSMVNSEGGAALSSFSYSYQLDGNQTRKTDHTGRVTSYVYDGLGRMTDEIESTGTHLHYTFDSRGNRAGMSSIGAETYATSYQYDDANRLLKTVKTQDAIERITNYTYDANGNQLSAISETLAPVGTSQQALQLTQDIAGVELMEYNGFNQMVRSNTDGAAVDYAYRPDGMRHSKTTGASTTVHLWDGANIVAETDGAGELTAKYIRGANLLYSEDAQGSRKHYQYNAHGDVVQLTGDSGQLLWTYDYDAFGVERVIDGQDMSTDANPFRYAGEYFDLSSGEYYLRNRYYNPAVGRFTQEDTVPYITYKLPNGQEVIDPLSLNLYTYCHNNPILYVDRSGNSPFVFSYVSDLKHNNGETVYVIGANPRIINVATSAFGFIPWGDIGFRKISESASGVNYFLDSAAYEKVLTGINHAGTLTNIISKGMLGVGAGWVANIITAYNTGKEMFSDNAVHEQITVRFFTPTASTEENAIAQYMLFRPFIDKLIEENIITYTTTWYGDLKDYQVDWDRYYKYAEEHDFDSEYIRETFK